MKFGFNRVILAIKERYRRDLKS